MTMVLTARWATTMIGTRTKTTMRSKASLRPKFRKFTRFILGEATQEHKTALVSRAYCTYRVSDITQAKQDRLPWGGVCGRGGKANGHVSAPRGKGPASAELTSEQQALS